MSCSVAVASCPLAALLPRSMRRCECAEVPFEDVARQVAAGRRLEEVFETTGCGQMCSACVPDLEQYLLTR